VPDVFWACMGGLCDRMTIDKVARLRAIDRTIDT